MRTRINRFATAVAASLLVVLLSAAVSGGRTNASATGRTWRAFVGNGWPTQQSGSNGVASIELYGTGDGALHLQLKNLVRNRAYSLTVIKGPYLRPSTTWSGRAEGCERVSDGPVVRLAALRTTASGRIDRSIALSVNQMAAINALPRRIAITVGSARLARCGGFQLQPQSAVGPAPSASPTPTVTPTPLPSPACSNWPAAIVDILAVLSTPDGLCLLEYPNASGAPAFMRGVGGIYFTDPPRIYYVVGVAGSETSVLAHEVCHAHQDRVTHDEGLTEFGEGWSLTTPGVDYLRLTGWHQQDGQWIEVPDAISNSTDPLEDNAVTCALWFDPAFGPHYLRRWAPIRFEWAQRWLPLPSFIVPWQGDAPTP